MEMKPPPLNDISTIVEAKRPQLPIPQWQDIDTAIGAWILRQFRKFGAKRREKWEQSAKRQAYLAQSWRDEMQRVKPNMLHLISGASFEKVPATWFGWNHSVSDVNKVMRAMNYSEIEAKRFLWKNRACNS